MTYLIDGHQAQALFEAQTSEWHRTDTRTPADVAWMYAKHAKRRSDMQITSGSSRR